MTRKLNQSLLYSILCQKNFKNPLLTKMPFRAQLYRGKITVIVLQYRKNKLTKSQKNVKRGVPVRYFLVLNTFWIRFFYVFTSNASGKRSFLETLNSIPEFTISIWLVYLYWHTNNTNYLLPVFVTAIISWPTLRDRW